MDLERYWEFQKLSWRVQRVGWAACFIILCAAGAGFLGGSVFSQRTFRAPGVEIVYENPMRLGVPTEFVLKSISHGAVSTPTSAPGESLISVMIGTEFVSNVDALTFLPEPESTRLTSDGLTLHYSGGLTHLRIRFTPESSGFLDVRLTFGSFQSSLRTLVLP